jgi:hypothetical protein
MLPVIGLVALAVYLDYRRRRNALDGLGAEYDVTYGIKTPVRTPPVAHRPPPVRYGPKSSYFAPISFDYTAQDVKKSAAGAGYGTGTSAGAVVAGAGSDLMERLKMQREASRSPVETIPTFTGDPKAPSADVEGSAFSRAWEGLKTVAKETAAEAKQAVAEAAPALANAAAKIAVASQMEKYEGILDANEVNQIGSAVGNWVESAVRSGELKSLDDLEASRDKLTEISKAAALEILYNKAANNELTADQIVKMERIAREESGRKIDTPLQGDENTLSNMRLVQTLKPKLDEETAKVQEEGYAPLMVNGKLKWSKIDLRDPANLENWRRQRAEQLASAYQGKMQPKIDAEARKVDEFIASRSPVVAKARDLISNGILENAPRMTPTASDDEGLKAFQAKYGYKGELTTDSYMRLIKDYANQMQDRLGGGGGTAGPDGSGSYGPAGPVGAKGPASSAGKPIGEGALGFIANDLKSNIDVLLPVFAQAADPTLDQKERYDRLKKFAGALDALTVEMAKRSVPKYLATQGDAQILAMMNQQVASGIAQERRKMLPTFATGGGKLMGLEDVAAMEFGGRRRRSAQMAQAGISFLPRQGGGGRGIQIAQSAGSWLPRRDFGW